MNVNSEGIYATRPWKVFGEGPGIKKTVPGEGMNGTPEHFNENKRTDLTGADIRFTTKGGVLYAFAMGHNAIETRIVSLAPSRGLAQRKVGHVELMGLPERLRWKQTDDALIIASPTRWPSEHAVMFKIQFV
jgi:alpha-L-fucosidase